MNIFNTANEIEMKVYETLKKVIDPEIGINIIDLGLVYKIEYDDTEGIKVELTLSTRGCPMGDVIIENMEREIKNSCPEKKIKINLVWEPSWKIDFVTDDGKAALGI